MASTINPARDAYVAKSINNALRRLSRRTSKNLQIRNYVPIQVQVIESRPGSPAAGHEQMTIMMPEQYMTGYDHEKN